MTITLRRGYIGLRYADITNEWIDFTVIVKEDNEEQSVDKIEKAMSQFYEQDDACFGDILEDFFPDHTIIYQDTEVDMEDEYEAVLEKIEWLWVNR